MAKKGLPELRIEPVDKGFIVHHTPPDSGSGPMPKTTKHIFADHSSMLAHVKKMTAPSGVPKTMKDSMHLEIAKAKARPMPFDDETD